MIPVADLHCDLLSYLAMPGKDALNPESRASLSQLEKGGVRLQTLACFTEQIPAKSQIRALHDLLLRYPDRVALAKRGEFPSDTSKVHFLPAIESASGFDLADLDTLDPILYLSLTWKFENRYGGGDETKVGLKPEGEILLEMLAERGIAIDLSHTSDHLAHDIFNAIDKKGLKLTPIASHSNFRSVHPHLRNLPDEFAKEILDRGGVIGLNLITKFVGKSLLDHLAHARSLGALDQICLGADFFYEEMLDRGPYFFDAYPNSSCYPALFEEMRKELSLDEIEKIAYLNFKRFWEER